MCVFAFFNMYLLWRLDKLEKEKTSYEDIKNIFEILIEKLESKDIYE